jgi:hypothetical protein
MSLVHVFGTAQAITATSSPTHVPHASSCWCITAFGIWCAARRLNQGRFALPVVGAVHPLPALSQAQFDVLVLGLPWQRLDQMRRIIRM